MLANEVVENLGHSTIGAAGALSGLMLSRSDVWIDLLAINAELPGGRNGRLMLVA